MVNIWLMMVNINHWLVVQYAPILKNSIIWVRQWEGWRPIYEMENNPVMFETTNQWLLTMINHD